MTTTKTNMLTDIEAGLLEGTLDTSFPNYWAIDLAEKRAARHLEARGLVILRKDRSGDLTLVPARGAVHKIRALLKEFALTDLSEALEDSAWDVADTLLNHLQHHGAIPQKENRALRERTRKAVEKILQANIKQLAATL